jgi:hypothetical protein
MACSRGASLIYLKIIQKQQHEYCQTTIRRIVVILLVPYHLRKLMEQMHPTLYSALLSSSSTVVLYMLEIKVFVVAPNTSTKYQ